MTDRLTAEDVRTARFKPPRLGKRGYNQAEVEQFLDRVATRLDHGNQPPPDALNSADVFNIAFSKPPIGQSGFDEDEVDMFLSRVEKEIGLLTPARLPINADGSSSRLTEEDVQRLQLRKPVLGKRGYDEESVTALLDRIGERLRLGTNPPPGALTAADVQYSAFKKPRFGRRGFDEDQVDEFLDRVVAELTLLEQGR